MFSITVIRFRALVSWKVRTIPARERAPCGTCSRRQLDDQELAGAVFLRLTTVTPVNLEPVVQAISPHVLPQYRRHGVGRMLMESAVTFAEELGVGHVATAAASGSRDANRFMARLGFGPQAVLRITTTHAVRGKLNAQRPAHQRAAGRNLPQVLAARRSMRRSQATGR